MQSASRGPRRAAIVSAAVVVAAFCASLTLRIAPVIPHVFRDGGVIFLGNDAWIEMRNVDVIRSNFPRSNVVDVYRLAPNPQRVAEAPLFGLAIASAEMLGAPFGFAPDAVAAVCAAVLGALLVVPGFLLAARLFGENAGRIAAVLLAVTPGQVLANSLLGNVTHRSAEALLVLCFLAAVCRQLDGEAHSWIGRAMPAVALSAYLLVWSRGAFLLLIVIGWALVQIAVDSLRGRVDGTVTRVVATALLPAAAIVAPIALGVPSMSLDVPLTLAGAAVVAAAEASALALRRRGMSGRATVAGGIAIAAASVAVALLAVPTLTDQLGANLARMRPSLPESTIAEVRPLLQGVEGLTLKPLWWELTSVSILGAAGLVILLAGVWRNHSREKTLFAVWAVTVIAAALMQARFVYYLDVAMAVLAACAAVAVMNAVTPRWIGAVALISIVIYPNIAPAIARASTPVEGPSRGWIEVLQWMRAHTDEPFGTAEAYVRRYGAEDVPPRAKYSTVVWCDYGYWLTRIARRPPAANPTQWGATEVAAFYTATSEEGALRALDRMNARYVLADDSLPVSITTAGRPQASLLDGIAAWARRDTKRWYDVYYEQDGDGARAVILYEPEYYQTMAIRLAANGGRAAKPRFSTWAVQTGTGSIGGVRRNVIRRSRRFATYEEASAFVRADPAWRIVGRSPIRSCVPVEALTRISLVKQSSAGQMFDGGFVPEVALFAVSR